MRIAAGAILWLALVYQVVRKVPVWLNGKKYAWLVQARVALLLLVGPFVDHIIGMQQFERLCEEQTLLQISPNAVNTKRGGEIFPAKKELLQGNFVDITKQSRVIIDLDTRQEIAQYKYFSTKGGRVGGLTMMGGDYTCSIDQPRHFDYQTFKTFATRINLTYGATE